MRQFRTSGVTRGERVAGHGMRAVSHVRGNPETDVYRSLNIGYQLSYSTDSLIIFTSACDCLGKISIQSSKRNSIRTSSAVQHSK